METEQNKNTGTPQNQSGVGAAQTAKYDWTKVNPEEIPHDVVSKTKAFKGVIADKQQLAEQLRAQRELLERVGNPPDESGKSESYDEDADRFITKREQDERTKKAVEEALAKRDQQLQLEKEQESIDRMSEQFSVETVGEDLTFNEVLKNGAKLVAKDYGLKGVPELFAMAKNMRDGAKFLYDLCLLKQPKLQAKLTAQQQSRELRQSTFRKPAGKLEAESDEDAELENMDFSKMSQSDFDALGKKFQ